MTALLARWTEKLAGGPQAGTSDSPPLARVMGVGRQQHLMVDGETYECVKSFCYLGDTLDGDGGADLAATARIRNGWMKFRELLPFLTSRAPPLEMKG